MSISEAWLSHGSDWTGPRAGVGCLTWQAGLKFKVVWALDPDPTTNELGVFVHLSFGLGGCEDWHEESGVVVRWLFFQ